MIGYNIKAIYELALKDSRPIKEYISELCVYESIYGVGCQSMIPTSFGRNVFSDALRFISKYTWYDK